MHSLESYCRRQSTERLVSVVRAYLSDRRSYAPEDVRLILAILLEREPDNEDFHSAWFALADEGTFQP